MPKLRYMSHVRRHGRSYYATIPLSEMMKSNLKEGDFIEVIINYEQDETSLDA